MVVSFAPTEETLRELVGQAHIFSTLLPLVSAYISPVAAIDPRVSHFANFLKHCRLSTVQCSAIVSILCHCFSEWCPLSPKRPINLISLSLQWMINPFKKFQTNPFECENDSDKESHRYFCQIRNSPNEEGNKQCLNTRYPWYVSFRVLWRSWAWYKTSYLQ